MPWEGTSAEWTGTCPAAHGWSPPGRRRRTRRRRPLPRRCSGPVARRPCGPRDNAAGCPGSNTAIRLRGPRGARAQRHPQHDRPDDIGRRCTGSSPPSASAACARESTSLVDNSSSAMSRPSVLVVVVQRRNRHADTARDLTHRRAVESGLVERVERGGQDRGELGRLQLPPIRHGHPVGDCVVGAVSIPAPQPIDRLSLTARGYPAEIEWNRSGPRRVQPFEGVGTTAPAHRTEMSGERTVPDHIRVDPDALLVAAAELEALALRLEASVQAADPAPDVPPPERKRCRG